jgi:hypothetical protein
LAVVKTCATSLLATLLLLTLAATAAAGPPAVRPGAPVSAHAMVHTCCTPPAMKERIFAEAGAMGARFIRVDVELSGIFGAGEEDDPDWTRLDAVMELSRRHRLPVLGIVLTPPSWVPPDQAEAFGRLAGEVAAHARDTITRWEILNEPDGAWAFGGTPEQYAHMLRAAYDAIHARVPEAVVAMGGVMTPESPSWIERVLVTPGADAAHAFDIANLHLRGHDRALPGLLSAWRDRLAGYGFAGPVWVTEHGYPADPAYQVDPAFHGGEGAQAAYLTESVLSLAEAGANEIFVTLRDNLDGGFASEGVVAIDDRAPFTVRRKPAFAAVRRLVDRWDELMAARADQRRAEEAARFERAQAAGWRVQAAGHRAAARSMSPKLTRLRARFRLARREHVRERLARAIDRTSLTLRRKRSDTGWARAMADLYAQRAGLYELYAAGRAAFVAGG